MFPRIFAQPCWSTWSSCAVLLESAEQMASSGEFSGFNLQKFRFVSTIFFYIQRPMKYRKIERRSLNKQCGVWILFRSVTVTWRIWNLGKWLVSNGTQPTSPWWLVLLYVLWRLSLLLAAAGLHPQAAHLAPQPSSFLTTQSRWGPGCCEQVATVVKICSVSWQLRQQRLHTATYHCEEAANLKGCTQGSAGFDENGLSWGLLHDKLMT